MQIDAPVVLTFLFDLTDAYPPNLAGPGDMSATARLQIHTLDID